MRVLLLAALAWGGSVFAADTNNNTVAGFLRQIRTIEAAETATLQIHPDRRSPYPIPANITGKFAEHLGANIYNGMDAQILRNPTFAEYPFWTGQMTPDGITKFIADEDRIQQELRRLATRAGFPEAELESLIASRKAALAALWLRDGPPDDVLTSPDTGPFGGRAQRVELRRAGHGIAQWCYLPLHRTHRYELEIFARSPNVPSLSVTLRSENSPDAAVKSKLAGLSADWKKLSCTLELPDNSPAQASYKLALSGDTPGDIVFQRVLLRPADHIHGADPDIIRFLKESKLPILRWPGGNFASGYHWQDGIGTAERRPTKPNYAWGGVEPNLFGTDEFIEFCRAAGCEPMICINAGDGTPEEAARWIEYCNGSAQSPMGSLRAANGHPEPYRVRHWEVGNELWGQWQFHWTTASGYVDRYRRFSSAMLKADSSVELYACGAPVIWGKNWNDTLIAGLGAALRATTDHPLIGGQVPPSTEPLDVYRDFMNVPELLEEKWGRLRDQMLRAGVNEPKLAVTELQLFARIGRSTDSSQPVRLTGDKLVNPGTLAEALYDVLIYHAAIRLAPFVEMVTHSAVVNHGGGLRKERERVYANPCYYAQAAFAAFASSVPVGVEISSGIQRAPRVLPEVKNAMINVNYPTIDALAALARDGSMLVSIVHRGSSGMVRLEIQLDKFHPSGRGQMHLLTADVPWAANTLASPEAVKPSDSEVAVENGRCIIDVRPYSVLRLRFPGRLD